MTKSVYPRGCGGTTLPSIRPGLAHGLSPWVRGNLYPAWVPPQLWGSIPVGAGEPSIDLRFEDLSAVYPRGCGGTSLSPHRSAGSSGLSPWVRGNRQWRKTRVVEHRSIPVGAGEPLPPLQGCGREMVYPRGCGGTAGRLSDVFTQDGLSPWVRGNLLCRGIQTEERRSIPVGAGEPVESGQCQVNSGVYPRGCGGTTESLSMTRHVVGLSPRVRGNPFRAGRYSTCSGSIPAGAGEPPTMRPTWAKRKVYPRGCGGTTRRGPSMGRATGLSPRVRGDPTQTAAVGVEAGSIPAGAGGPSFQSAMEGLKLVYPRGCGGTLQYSSNS